MEKVYWVLDDNSLREINRQLEKYDGHVATITAVPAKNALVYRFDDEDYPDCSPAHAFVVAVYRRDKLPKIRHTVSYHGIIGIYETDGDM